MSRPALRYHGGKWKLAPWIISHFPPHRIYVEPFGGAASVLLRKPRSYAEVYNDLDDEVVGLFRVLRDPASAERLIEMLRLTPYARAEFEAAYSGTDCPVERARRVVVRAYMGFGSDGVHSHHRTGFRAAAMRNGSTPAIDWRNLADAYVHLVERLRGVTIENKNALEVMIQHDSDQTLHYLDPPYVHETRSRVNAGRGYRHELTDEQHAELIEVAQGLDGAVVLSGYRCSLYDRLLSDWRRVDRKTHADGAAERTESLWLNARADVSDLFSGASEEAA